MTTRRNFLKMLGALPALRFPKAQPPPEPGTVDLPMANHTPFRVDALGVMVNDRSGEIGKPVYATDTGGVSLAGRDDEPIGFISAVNDDGTVIVDINPIQSFVFTLE